MIKNQDFKRNLHIDELIKDAIDKNEGVIAVSYTHLTLPTILLV